MLVGQFKSVVPGYYMNKKHWVTISLSGELPEGMLDELAKGSYNLVTSELSKKEKAALNNL
jgi:predicted DNA-binding protein (MmcQ/YjbR family)